MKEPYIEGVATHGDPESCTAGRKAVREALTGALTGWVLSREISQSRMPRKLCNPKATRPVCASASSRTILRGRRPHAREESFCTGTGRSLRRPTEMVGRAASRRLEAQSR